MKCNCTCDNTSARRRRTSTARRRVYAKRASKWAHKNRKNNGSERKAEYLQRIRHKK